MLIQEQYKSNLQVVLNHLVLVWQGMSGVHESTQDIVPDDLVDLISPVPAATPLVALMLPCSSLPLPRRRRLPERPVSRKAAEVLF